MFETFESRQLLSGGGETLYINGTNGPDSIVITATATDIVVKMNGVTTSYAKSWYIPSPNQWIPGTSGFISGIEVDGGEGNDIIWSDDTVTVPQTLIGGNGTDSIRGGHANDGLYGGFGPYFRSPYDIEASPDDSLDGGAGNDYLDGAEGYPVFYGGIGNDTLHGGDGTGVDLMYGGAGDDLLNSYRANSTLFGDAGNDTLFGHGSGAMPATIPSKATAKTTWSPAAPTTT